MKNTYSIHDFTQITQDSLKLNQITELSDIQKKAIPFIVEGKDVLVHSPTGSGKTNVYLLPVIDKLEPQGNKKHFAKAIVLAPTRELSLQIADRARKLLSNREGIRTTVLSGGVDIQKQIRMNAKGADIVIGTPARIADHLRRHTLKPNQLETLIVDEADMMLTMGFLEDIKNVLSYLPEHQTILLSATFEEGIREMQRDMMIDPVIVESKNKDFLKQEIALEYMFVQGNKRIEPLVKILNQEHTDAIIFCNTRNTSDFVADMLRKNGIETYAIHSEMDYGERKKIMKDFVSHKINVLVATDVASRGIDIPAVGLVINFDYPDQSSYLKHRIGRTARASRKGKAITMLKENQKNKIREIQNIMGIQPKRRG